MISHLFIPPDSNVKLNDDEIHVWKASLDQPACIVHTLAKTLSVDEKKRSERFHFERDRERFIIGRGILRTILSGYLSVEPSRVQFCYGKHGKPALADTFEKGRIRFNLSHSEGLALYVFTRNREIGVDIEHIHDIPEMERIVEHFFSVREQAVFRELPQSKKKEVFFSYWTRKEAFIKAKGESIGLGLNQFEVSLPIGEPAALLSTNGAPQIAYRWSLRELDYKPGFVAALAVQGHGWQLKYWLWPGEHSDEAKANDSN